MMLTRASVILRTKGLLSVTTDDMESRNSLQVLTALLWVSGS